MIRPFNVLVVIALAFFAAIPLAVHGYVADWVLMALWAAFAIVAIGLLYKATTE